MQLSATVAIKVLANLKFTLVILVLMAVGVVISDQEFFSQTWSLAVPLFLLAVNLLASIVVNPKFRQQIPLLFFHLSLLAILLFVVAGRLTYLVGQTALTEDAEFSGELDKFRSGPWHKDRLQEIQFVNHGYDAAYVPRLADQNRMIRKETFNQVTWRDFSGNWQEAVIGDDHPLVLKGYRIYTTTAMGFAMQFSYYPDNNALPYGGEIHLNPYFAYQDIQAQTWVLPDESETVWVFLEIEGDVLDTGKLSYFQPPDQHQIVLGSGEQGDIKQVLKPGESVQLSEGLLVYRGLTTWMGYRVVYDWTLNWIAAASFLAVFSLMWFYWQRFSTRSWINKEDQLDEGDTL